LQKNIEIYQFGKNHYRVSSTPSWLSLNQVETFVREVIQSSAECDFNEDIKSADEKFSKIASRYARYEHYTTGDDITNLASSLLKCENFSRGPDGETPFSKYSKAIFLKRFLFL
jgi:DNA mismatch repair ATPase MutL